MAHRFPGTGVIVIWAFVMAASTAGASPLDLAEVLERTRKNAVEIEEPRAQIEQARAESKAPNAAYDWTFFGNGRWLQDWSEQNSAFAGDRRDQGLGEFGARRMFPTATLFQASLKHQRDFTDYPRVESLIADPAAPPATPAIDVSKFQSFNPAYATRLEISARQPLWRNRFGRELRLQEDVALTGMIQPFHVERLKEQGVQAEAEQLYWALASTEAQLVVSEELVAKAKKFADLMSERVKLGRAEAVDAVAADSAMVAQEGFRLELRLAVEELRRRLSLRMGEGPHPEAEWTPGDVLDRLTQNGIPRWAGEAMDRALKDRFDIRMIDRLAEALGLQEEMAREQKKPSLSLVGSAGSAGLESGAFSSLPDSIDDPRHLTYLVGFEFELNFDRTGPTTRLESLAAQRSALAARRRQIETDVRKELDLAYQALSAADQRLKQAERQLATIETKRLAEEKKFQQARTDEVALVRYDMEWLSQRMQIIGAHRSMREAEARVRFALHAYPRSGS